MDLGIRGKLAVVIGGSRNLGRAVVEELAREGCRVVLVSRGSKEAEEIVAALAAEGREISSLKGDLNHPESIAATFTEIRNHHGSPDILVYSNAGPPDAQFDVAVQADYLTGYQVIVLGFVQCVAEVVEHMKASGWGRIVTLGSMCAKHPHREVPMIVHNIVRPAALGASRTLANELGKFGITVNTIGTGRIDSGEGGSFRRTYRGVAAERGGSAEELIATMLKGIAVGRAGKPKEVGSLCAFLCSDLAGFITGQLIICDGGQNNVLF